MKIRICLRSDKLDMHGRARALELEEADLEQLAWHAACLEEDIEILKAEAELLRKAVLAERQACVEICRDVARDRALVGDRDGASAAGECAETIRGDA